MMMMMMITRRTTYANQFVINISTFFTKYFAEFYEEFRDWPHCFVPREVIFQCNSKVFGYI